MTSSKANTLVSFFTTVVNKAPNNSSLSAGDQKLKQVLSSLDTSSSPASSSFSTKPSPKRKIKPALHASHNRRQLDSASKDDSMNKLTGDVSSILLGTCGVCNLHDSEEVTHNTNSLGRVLSTPWLSNLSHTEISLKRKEVSRERKEKWVFNKTQVDRFNRLLKFAGDKLGTNVTLKVLDKLGREFGVKEYNAVIAVCLQKARRGDDEVDALEHISEAFKYFKEMGEQGFQVEEETYGLFLRFFIDTGMVEEFYFFCGLIKEGNSSALPRLGFYEMLLWIGVNNEEKIQELCKYIANGDVEDDFKLKENYLLALIKSGRQKEVMQLLEIIDVKKISSANLVANIFQSLGNLSLESLAEKFFLAFKECDFGVDDISRFIFSYASGIPDLVVEDFVLKFKSLHMKFNIRPSAASYQKLIANCCDLHKSSVSWYNLMGFVPGSVRSRTISDRGASRVHLALEIVEEMCETGLSFSIETLHKILYASEESFEYNLVGRIYSLICHHDLKPKSETFRSMINLSVKMKDFDSAYALLNDLKKLNIPATASIYNAIMAGYFREKNFNSALAVLRQMELDDVKPDSQTFSYLIGNCDSEERINKYCEEMKRTGIPVTKNIFMSLINAYTACGLFEKAKEVLLDKGIPIKSLNEIKSVLVSALASSGKTPNALSIYEEIKQNGGSVEPKAVISLIEHFPSEGELSTLLQLLEELHDPDFWVDGCCRVLLHCVRNKHVRSAVDLLKQLKDKYHNDNLMMEVIFDEVFFVIAEREPKDLHIGLALLRAMKDELGLNPSRKSLDFLLSACINARDLQNSLLIWNEYQAAGLPCNVLTFLRMYQALLASGDPKSAKKMLSKMPTDDPHVRCIINACQTTYVHPTSSKIKKRATAAELE